MTDQPTPSSDPKPERSRTLRVTLRIGETVAVLGLVLAAVTFFVGRSDRRAEDAAERRERAEAVQREARAEALVLRAMVDGEGERVFLEPVSTDQVIQTQRYIFPRAVRENAREIGAGRPQIEAAWIASGLLRERRRLEQAGEEPPPGEARVPVAVLTTFIDDGVMRTDRAIYRLGYVVRRGALARSRVELQGVSLLRRASGDNLQVQVDALWAQSRPMAPPSEG